MTLYEAQRASYRRSVCLTDRREPTHTKKICGGSRGTKRKTADEEHGPEDEDDEDAQHECSLEVVNHNVLALHKKFKILVDLFTTNAVLQGHGVVGGGAPGVASTSSLTSGLTSAVMRDVANKVFFGVSGYYGVEELVVCVTTEQNLDVAKIGNKVAVRGFIADGPTSTSTNMRSRLMRKYIANSGDNPQTFIPDLDTYLAADESGHVLDQLIGKGTMLDFINRADFNGMDSMLTAIRKTSRDLDTPFGDYISPALLATVLLSFLIKKKLVSDPVLSSHYAVALTPVL